MNAPISESEWKNTMDHLEQLKAAFKAAEEELSEVASYMPDCWPDDASPTEFVASLVAGETDYPGHADECDCFG